MNQNGDFSPSEGRVSIHIDRFAKNLENETFIKKICKMLMIEIYTVINNIVPQIVNSHFHFRENVHIIRNFRILSNSTKKTVRYGLETVSHRSLFSWTNLPKVYKSQTTLHAFKANLERKLKIVISSIKNIYIHICPTHVRIIDDNYHML